MSSSARQYDDVSPAEGDAPRPLAARPTLENMSRVDNRERHKTSLIFSPPMVSAVLRSPHRIFRMRGTFVLDSKHLEDGTIFVRHRELPVYGYGETIAEALNGFAEMFELQWSSLVEGDDADLAEDAIIARQQFRDAVQDVLSR